MALKHVYYHMGNELPVQVQCIDTGYSGLVHWDDPDGWDGEGSGGGSGWGTHVHPWWIHVNVWQNQYNI